MLVAMLLRTSPVACPVMNQSTLVLFCNQRGGSTLKIDVSAIILVTVHEFQNLELSGCPHFPGMFPGLQSHPASGNKICETHHVVARHHRKSPNDFIPAYFWHIVFHNSVWLIVFVMLQNPISFPNPPTQTPHVFPSSDEHGNHEKHFVPAHSQSVGHRPPAP